MKTLFLSLAFALSLLAQSSPFPVTMDTNGNLKVAADNCSTSLTAGMLIGDTTAQVANATCIPNNSIITIDSEQMGVCSISGNTLTFGTATVCPSISGRGLSSTTVATHALGALGFLLIDAYHHASLAAAVKALEASLYPGPIFAGAASFGGTATPPLRPEWFGATVTAQAGSVDTLYGALANAHLSLPLISTNGQGLKTVKGAIYFADTGLGSNAYNLGQPANISSQVLYKGLGTGSKIGIAATNSFANGNYMLSAINANGYGDTPNTNFATRIDNITLDAVTNNASCGTVVNGLSFAASTGSRLTAFHYYGYGIGIIVGGTQPGAGADNISGDDLELGLYPCSGALNAQAIVWPQSVDTNANTFTNGKVVGSLTPNTIPCSYPTLDLGASNNGINLIGWNVENVPCVGIIGASSHGEHFSGVAYPDCGTCSPANYPYGWLIDPTAVDALVDLSFYGYRAGGILGGRWRSQAWATNATVVDNLGHKQEVTAGGGGTAGASQPNPWNELTAGTCSLGGSAPCLTTDGPLTWTDQGLIIQICNALQSITTNCLLPTINAANGSLTGLPGATSSTDLTEYHLYYDSTRFFSPSPPSQLGRLVAANFNATTDQQIPLSFPVGSTHAILRHISIDQCTIEMTAAAGGIYPAASKSGQVYVAAGQTYDITPFENYFFKDLTIASSYVTGGSTLSIANTPLYFSLTTPQGSAGTCDISVLADFLP